MNARSSSEPKAQSLRTRLREATAQAIIDAAEQVFADKGLQAHMNDIAAGAGVAVGTLYNHFKDRDALLSEILEVRRSGLLEVMDQFLAQPSSGDFRTDLTGLVQRMGDYFDLHRRFHMILHQLEYGANLASYPETAAGAPAMKREMNLRLEKVVKRGLKLKALRSELADFYPGLLMGILRSVRVHMAESGKEEHMPISEIVRFFMDGARA